MQQIPENSPERSFDDFSEADIAEFCEERVAADGKKFHHCTYLDCAKAFRFKSEFFRHLVIHFPKRPYRCQFEGCTKTFKRVDALENHKRIHTKAMPFGCENPGCDQKFTTKAALRYHLLKHKDERAYECSVPDCGKRFLTLSQLKQHEKASVYHWRISSKKQPSTKEEESTIASSPTQEEPPVQKHVHCSEEKNIPPVKQEEEEEEMQLTKQELPNTNYQTLLKCVLLENKMLEEKLESYDKIIDSIQPKIEIRPQRNNTLNDYLDTFFSEHEPLIFDYLRRKYRLSFDFSSMANF